MGLIKSSHVPLTASAFSMRDIEEQARGMLLRARQQADQLLAAAQTEAEQIKRDALAEGLAQGKQQGLAAGIEEGKKAGAAQALAESRQQLKDALGALVQAMAMLDAHRAELETMAVQDVVRLSLAVAHRVAKRQARIDPQVLAANLQDAMKLVVQQSDLRVAIHPSQKSVLDAALPQLAMSWPALAHAEVIEDPALTPGGCRIFTRHGQIDADLDSQLDRITSELLPGSQEPDA